MLLNVDDRLNADVALLCHSAASGDMAGLQKAIKMKADSNISCNEDEQTPLMFAAQRGDGARITTDAVYNPIVEAAAFADTRILKYILEKGGAADGEAVFVATQNDNAAAIELLAAAKAGLNGAYGKNHFTPLISAARENKLQALAALSIAVEAKEPGIAASRWQASPHVLQDLKASILSFSVAKIND